MLRIDPILPYEAPLGGLRPDDRDSLDADAIIRFVHRRRRLCLTWLGAGMVLGVILAAIMPAHYTASTSVLLEGAAARPLDGAPAATDAANSTYVETQVQVLSSDEVIGRVVDRKNLTEDAEFGGNSGLKVLLKRFARTVLDSERKTKAPDRRYATIVRVRRALAVARVGMSNVVDVRFTSRDPVRSATITNAIVQSYVEARLMLQRAAREETAAHLREQLAELREKAFPADPQQEAAAATAEPAAQARARFREMQDSMTTYRAMYDRLLQRVYGDVDSGAGASIRVITPAEPPLFAGSQLIIVLAVVGVAGVAGVGHALLQEMADRRVTSTADVQKATGIPRVTGIPKLETEAWKIDDRVPGYLQPTYTKVSDLLYEKMARLAVTLQEGQVRRTGWVIAIASPDEGAGASSVASHLARVIAESGQKTVLVDANWRKPLAGQVAANPGPNRKLVRGLATIPLDSEALEVIVLRATTPISELNASRSIGSALEGLGADYDFVVVDLHSCGQTADTAAGSVEFHEIIVVAQAGLTTSDRLASYVNDLPRDKIAAVILNLA